MKLERRPERACNSVETFGFKMGLSYQGGDSSCYAVFDVSGPQHLGDVHGQGEAGQQEGLSMKP